MGLHWLPAAWMQRAMALLAPDRFTRADRDLERVRRDGSGAEHGIRRLAQALVAAERGDLGGARALLADPPTADSSVARVLDHRDVAWLAEGIRHHQPGMHDTLRRWLDALAAALHDGHH